MEVAIRVALDRHGVTVHRPQQDSSLLESVAVESPDLLVLIGDAARSDADELLQTLMADPAASRVPAVLVADDPPLESRLRAFRSGAIAVVPRGASADAIAARIAELAREVPEDSGSFQGELGEATLDELTALVADELRRSITSADGVDTKSIRLMLGAGLPVAEALEAFVSQLKPLVEQSDSVHEELFDPTGTEWSELGNGSSDPFSDLSLLSGLRLLLMDTDPGRADTLAQAMRLHDAEVVVTQVSIDGFKRAYGFDPEVVILDSTALDDGRFETVRHLRKNIRLRWASLLVVRWEDIWPPSSPSPDIAQLSARIAPLTQHDRTLKSQAQTENTLETRIERTGPGRMLRILSSVPGNVHMTAKSTKARFEIDLAEGLIVGATCMRHGAGAGTSEGIAALRDFLDLGSAQVFIEKRPHPSVANVMTPVEEALDAATAEFEQNRTLPESSLAPEFQRAHDEPTAREVAAEAPASLESSVPTRQPAADPDAEEQPKAVALRPPKLPSALLTGGSDQMPLADFEGEDSSQITIRREGLTSEYATWDTDMSVEETRISHISSEAVVPHLDQVPTSVQPIDSLTDHRFDLLGVEELRDSDVLTIRDSDLLRIQKQPGAPALPVASASSKEGAADPPNDADAHLSDSELPTTPHAPVDQLHNATVPPWSDAPGASEFDETFPPASSLTRWLISGVAWTALLSTVIGGGWFLWHASATHSAAEPATQEAESPRLPEAAGARTEEPSAGQEQPVTETPELRSDTQSRTAEPIAEAEQTASAETSTAEQTAAAEQTSTAEETSRPESVELESQGSPRETTSDIATTGENQPRLPTRLDEITRTPAGERDLSASRARSTEGRRYLRRERIEEATEAFFEALQLDDSNPHSMIGLAEIHLAQGNPEAAIEFARRAVQLRGRRSRYRLILGDAYRANEQLAEARAEYRNALKLEPDDQAILSRLSSTR